MALTLATLVNNPPRQIYHLLEGSAWNNCRILSRHFPPHRMAPKFFVENPKNNIVFVVEIFRRKLAFAEIFSTKWVFDEVDFRQRNSLPRKFSSKRPELRISSVSSFSDFDLLLHLKTLSNSDILDSSISRVGVVMPFVFKSGFRDGF